jgi:hypothetical protein
LVPYIVVKRYFQRGLLLCLALLALTYLSDYLIFHYRAAYSSSGSAYGTVNLYVAETKKNGSVELYYRNPEATVCARSLFPHSGYTPCWYLGRLTEKVI